MKSLYAICMALLVANLMISPANGAQGESYSISLLDGPTLTLKQSSFAAKETIQKRWEQLKTAAPAAAAVKMDKAQPTESDWLVALFLKLTQVEFAQRQAERELGKQMFRAPYDREIPRTDLPDAELRRFQDQMKQMQDTVYGVYWLRADVLARLKTLVSPDVLKQLTQYAASSATTAYGQAAATPSPGR